MASEFDFLSPGIKIREIDQSVIPAEAAEDGPIIIGRTKKGPAMEPVRVKSLDAFIKTFGKPVAGGTAANSDVWRDGPNASATTYAAYAAQAWLASGNGPCTIVRLLGDQTTLTTPSGNGVAGWQLSSSKPSTVTTDNSTAYGLFVIDSGSIKPPTTILTFNQNTSGSYKGKTLTIDDVTFEFTDDTSTGVTAGNVEVSLDDAGTNDTGVEYGPEFKDVIDTQILGGALSNISASVDERKVTITNIGPRAISISSSMAAADIVIGATGSNTTTLSGIKLGSLGAVFYVDSGYLELTGALPNGTNTAGAAKLIKSNAVLGFGIDIYNKSGTKIGSTNNFNFDRASAKYIRNVFNTNPQLINSTMTPSNEVKTYWLGETFEKSLKSDVTSSTAGAQLGVLLPLHRADNASAASGNWGYHRVAHSVAKSGWVISKYEGADADFNIRTVASNPLFRFCSLHGGDDLQKDIMIGIEDIRLPVNPNVDGYATFSVCVKDMSGNTLEKFTGCTLDTESPNFVSIKIGDIYAESWDETNLKYNYAGDYPNNSNYIRVELAKTSFAKADVPFGFIGPERPVGFVARKGLPGVKNHDGAALTASFAMGSGSVPSTEEASGADFIQGLATDGDTLGLQFPSIRLRVSGSDGNAPNPYKVYFGIRPKLNATTNQNDIDYVDYLRALPSNYNTEQHKSAGALATNGFEPSFIFSLDDIVIDEAANTVTYVSGSRKLGTSYTAKSGSKALTSTKKVRQFVMPMYGGRHGLDIREMEPFRNSLVEGYGNLESSNSLLFSIKKALNSAADPEVVPANLLLAPGFYVPTVTNTVIDIADARQDVLAIIDLENDYKSVYESSDAISTRRGSVQSAITSIETRELDSTFACCFYPAVQAIDPLNNNRRIWLPASVAGLGGIAQSEAASAAWFAPAGFNRGGLGALGGSSGPVVTQARQRLDSDERDDLYEVNINPIATFPNEGVVIFGQKTLQAASNSALSRINVRRLLIYLKSRISAVARNLLFDQNVPSTWARFVGEAEPILDDVRARFGLTDYRLVLDETTTTAELIDKNILYAQVYLKPARAIEYIAIDFIVTRTGASFV